MLLPAVSDTNHLAGYHNSGSHKRMNSPVSRSKFAIVNLILCYNFSIFSNSYIFFFPCLVWLIWESDLPFKTSWLFDPPTCLTLKNSTVCPHCIYVFCIYLRKTVGSAHTVLMCFVFISEQTATCATYSINWLVFIAEMKSVYSAVRTGA